MGTDRPARRRTVDTTPDAGVASEQRERHQAEPGRTAHHGSGHSFNPRVVGSSPTGPTRSEVRFFWTRWHEGLRILGVFAATGNGAGTDLLVSAAGGQVLWERAVHDRLGGPKSAGPFAGLGGTPQTWASAAGQRVAEVGTDRGPGQPRCSPLVRAARPSSAEPVEAELVRVVRCDWPQASPALPPGLPGTGRSPGATRPRSRRVVSRRCVRVRARRARGPRPSPRCRERSGWGI